MPPNPKSVVTSITLPLAPSANRYWRHVNTKTGARVLVSAEAKAYKDHVGWLLKAAGVELTMRPVSLRLDVYRKRKAGDLDNYVKILADAMTGIAYADDSQIVEIVARRFDDPTDPRVEVVIEEVRA